MSTFFTDLWSSVFTAGPTPTLLVATNATFAALQLVLFLLLLATYSIHFIILSFLSAALWWSINWFAAELNESRGKEDALKAEQSQSSIKGPLRRAPGAIDTSESETETESIIGSHDKAPASNLRGSRQSSIGPSTSTFTSGSAIRPDLLKEDDDTKKRRSLPENSGYASTDSEWEKVDS